MGIKIYDQAMTRLKEIAEKGTEASVTFSYCPPNGNSNSTIVFQQWAWEGRTAQKGKKR